MTTKDKKELRGMATFTFLIACGFVAVLYGATFLGIISHLIWDTPIF